MHKRHSFQKITQLFRQKATFYPRKLAVCDKSTRINYLELDQRSDDFAEQLLKHHKAKPGQPIALEYQKKSVEMMVNLLGILKTNSPYLPIDPNLT